MPTAAARAQAAQVSQRAAQIEHQLAVPWADLFGTLEALGTDDVTLLRVEPDPSLGTIGIAGEARNLQAMVEYARRVGASAAFGDVYVKSHSVVTADPQRPVRFELVGRWIAVNGAGGKP
jgi:hypothetical protein